MPTVAESAALIAFSRGLDVDDLDGDSETNEARDWVFGDALHSRPLPINYGSIGGYSDPDSPTYGSVEVLPNKPSTALGGDAPEFLRFSPRLETQLRG